MSTGLSIWWATPANPAQHFSDEELQASNRYHGPIRRAGLLATAAKVALLVGAVVLVTGPSFDPESGLFVDSGRASADSSASAGFLELLTSRSLLIGAGMATAALRGPAIAVDAWFEYRFRHGADPSEDFEPVRPHRFATTVVLLSALVWSGLVVIGAAIYPLVAASPRWLFLVAGIVWSAVWLAAVVERPVRQRLSGRPAPLDPQSAGFDRLVTSFGLDGIPMLVGASSSAPTPLARHHFNAASMGLGGNRRIVVSSGLLDRPVPVKEFVVAHELSHLGRHHLVIQTAVAAAAAAASIVVVGVAAGIDRLGAAPGIDLTDPLHMPAVVLLVVAAGAIIGPAVAWVGRAQERVADADAIAAVGPLPVEFARQLHAQANTDLDPPRWIRLFAHHPSPAERLEFAERHRRSN